MDSNRFDTEPVHAGIPDEIPTNPNPTCPVEPPCDGLTALAVKYSDIDRRLRRVEWNQSVTNAFLRQIALRLNIDLQEPPRMETIQPPPPHTDAE